MLVEDKCPLCGSTYVDTIGCSHSMAERGEWLKCAHYDRTCIVDDSVLHAYGEVDAHEVCRRTNAIVSVLIQNPYASNSHRQYWRFIYEEDAKGKSIPRSSSADDPVNFNVANEMVDYPRSFQQQINNDTREIGEAFRDAISECGYNPCRIDQKEHNNQIVPEIFFEIKRSRFLVVDVTYPNYGAYYEAGYGEALNKQVIVCCRKGVFDSESKPHFDIAQKSTVVWSDLDDLKSKLKTRIEATVGLIRGSVR